MTRVVPMLLGVVAILSTGGAGRATAQSLGTFRWQLQPFCNVVVVSITQQGGNYQIDGFDDQCGAAQRAPLVGLATLNPDATIGFGLAIVTVPGGRGVHVDARISLPGLGGPWTDSLGNAGTFAFGASTGGAPRPLAGIGAIAVNPAQVQLRVSGACSTGQLIKAVNQDGTVTCAAAGDIDTVFAGDGLRGGGTSGDVFLELRKTSNGGFDLTNSNGFVSAAPLNMASGFAAVEGPGRRFYWYPAEAALRAGRVDGTQWDGANIGFGSVALGGNTMASGVYSLAMGDQTSAGGDTSVTLGYKAVATPAADGSFVFSDRSSGNTFTSFAPNEFVARAAGGVGFYTNAATTTGVELAKNGSSWASLSDVNAKENFRDVEGEEVLAKLARVPIREWNYKAQDATIRHMGPTAQDFRAAFGLGDFPLRINTIDADGVALAGVKALDARTREMREASVEREEDFARTMHELRQRIDALERALAATKDGGR